MSGVRGDAANAFLPASGNPSSTPLHNAGAGAPKERLVRIARTELARVRSQVASSGHGRLLLNVDADLELGVAVERTSPTRWGYSLSGRIDSPTVGFVTMVVHDEAVAGAIWTPNASYEIVPLGGGVHAVREVEDHGHERRPHLHVPAAIDRPAREHPASDEDTVVDVLVVWTPQREAGAGGVDAVRAEIELGIAYTNDAFERSGAFVSLNLVGAEPVTDYEEPESDDPTYTEFLRLVDPADGHMDAVHSRRDALGADLVSLASNGGIAGGNTFSISTKDPGIVAHEFGHNFGLDHEHAIGPGGDEKGYTALRDRRCTSTIMSYNWRCAKWRRSYFPPLFSSPAIYDPIDGVPLGVSRFSDRLGAAGPADAVRHLNLTRNTIAALRPSRSHGDSAVVANQLGSGLADAVATSRDMMSGVLGTAEPSDPDALVDIPDAVLRRALEEELGKEEGEPITRGDMADLRRLPLEGVDELTTWGLGIEDLTGLEHATDLGHLFLSDNAVADLMPIGNLLSLRNLYLDGNAVSDIVPLAGLSHVASLSLSNTNVEDLSPLADISFRWLALDGNSIRDLSPLRISPIYFFLTNNSISDISHIGRMSTEWLHELRLSGNSIRSLAPLAGLPRLAHVFLNDNQVESLAGLNFERLDELHLRNNDVRDLSPLLDSEALLMVDVRRNPLEDDALTVLETLRERGVTVLAGESVPYFPAAGGENEGFVRVVNRSNASGEVFIEAVDDAGVRVGPDGLRLRARRAVHFDSSDLQNGHAAKGFAGIGPPTAGDWRLEVVSALDIEVLSYVRAEDGLVTPMHDIAREGSGSGWLPSFGVFDSAGGGSILRVVNTEAERARWTTGGYDDRGSWRAMANAFVLPGGSALTFTAEQLRDDHGLGDGGRQMRARGFPWFAQHLYASPSGHLTNLSTTPANSAEPLADGAGRHRVPLLPAAADPREGLVRVINRSAGAGETTIEAVDDEGNRFGPVLLTLGPRQAAVFSSADLEYGNDAAGLAGTIGPGEGDWRLSLTSTLDLQVLSYVRSEGGFVSAMHDSAPVAENGSHRIVYFNPASNRRYVSKLRLANNGEQNAEVTITGMDDRGAQSGTVTLTVPAMSATTLTSAQLESGGGGFAGSLGDGYGKWRLWVESDEPLTAMSLVESRGGQLVNVSTATAD